MGAGNDKKGRGKTVFDDSLKRKGYCSGSRSGKEFGVGTKKARGRAEIGVNWGRTIKKGAPPRRGKAEIGGWGARRTKGTE